MRTRRLVIVGLVAAAIATAPAGSSEAANTLCVGGQGCYATLQAAVDAAQNGDTIHLNAGTFAGGVTIPKSVGLVGAGAQQTTIRGGGPVLTIGTTNAPTEPTVSIEGVTITGGDTTSSPKAHGGGIEAVENGEQSGGANLTIKDSVITGNRAAPTGSAPLGPPCPGGGNCPFALAAGGGIDTFGDLTLTDSTVSGNVVGGDASDADGGGIASHHGRLVIQGSTISDNRAIAVAPNGRFADSGGIFVEHGTVTITASTVKGNAASLTAAFPNSVETLAVAGGIHLTDGVTSARITNTTVSGNAVSMTNTAGSSNAFSGGVHTDRVVTLQNDVIADNTVTSRALGTTGDAEGDSGVGELAGTIKNSHLTGNTVSVSSAAGTANASAGATIFTGTMTNSVVADNRVEVTAPKSTVTLAGAGVQTGGRLTLAKTRVTGNTGHATGVKGKARGGGIFAVDEAPNGPPGGRLILANSVVTGNSLTGSGSVAIKGGGLYVTNPLRRKHTTIARNTPDNCSGKSCATSVKRR